MAQKRGPAPCPYLREETFDATLRIDVTRARVTLAELQGLLAALDVLLQATPYSGADIEEAQQWVYTADRLFTPGEEGEVLNPSDLQKQGANLDADIAAVVEKIRTAAVMRNRVVRMPHTQGKSPKAAPLRAPVPEPQQGPRRRRVE